MKSVTLYLVLVFQIMNCLISGGISAEDLEEDTDADVDQEDATVQKREPSKLSGNEETVRLSRLAGDINPCSLGPEIGNCQEKMVQRYYYDNLQKNCLPFEYTGCDANENNFESLNECENICIKKRDTRKVATPNKFKTLKQLSTSLKKGSAGTAFGIRKFPAVFCDLERDNGLICPGVKRGNYLSQFYFDKDKNRCIQFTYNGCGGNANRFSSIWECTLACEKVST